MPTQKVLITEPGHLLLFNPIAPKAGVQSRHGIRGLETRTYPEYWQLETRTDLAPGQSPKLGLLCTQHTLGEWWVL